MTQTDSELMTRARLYHGDGLIDLAFGLIVLSLGLAELFGWELYVLFIFVLLWVPLERALKQRITVPRLRNMPFVPSQNLVQRQRRVLLVTGIGVAIVLLLLLVIQVIGLGMLPAAVSTGLQRAAPLLWLLVTAGVLVLFAWTIAAKRVVVYIGLLAIVVLNGFWLPGIVPMLFVALGAGIMMAGAALLARFMHDHPLQAGAQHRGGRP